jgi:hypothetical protein
MPQSVTLDLNRNELFSRHSIVSQSPSLLFGRVQASPAKNPDILAKAKDMLNYRKRTLATDMRDKYHSVIEKYRKRFQKGYVESLSPPGTWEFSVHETRDMRLESTKLFQGMIKQKDSRIGINIRQTIHEKSREELSISKFLKKAEEEYINE